MTCKKDFEDGALLSSVEDETQLARIHALSLQASLGNYEGKSFMRHSRRLQWSDDFTQAVAIEYAKLTDIKGPSAEYKCLKEFSSLRNFSYEHHSVKTDDNSVSQVAVGSEGLRIFDENFTVLQRYDLKLKLSMSM